ncbi:MAG: hypothetical protein HW416_2077 [Chloroflexi bacterium]|nr:hypothetical protein [Chloroflexota bacterium]
MRDGKPKPLPRGFNPSGVVPNANARTHGPRAARWLATCPLGLPVPPAGSGAAPMPAVYAQSERNSDDFFIPHEAVRDVVEDRVRVDIRTAEPIGIPSGR